MPWIGNKQVPIGESPPFSLFPTLSRVRFLLGLMNYARVNYYTHDVVAACRSDKNRTMRITLTMLSCLLACFASCCYCCTVVAVLPMWKPCVTNTIYKQNENRTRYHITPSTVLLSLCAVCGVCFEYIQWMCMHRNHMSLALFYFSAFLFIRIQALFWGFLLFRYAQLCRV